MTDRELLVIVNKYIKEKIDTGCDIDSTIDTLNKLSEVNSIFANFLRDKLDPLRRSIFMEQLDLWTKEEKTSREFSGIFRGK